ncbi:virulence associated lipoprotein [Borrelia hispanica]|uniref:virulence associated lipoprotein n=1 Tax=Borrelia hispanica TaxID=40835 RepID=UPI0004B11F1A|nr:virulence associated lipoprotein [Borrelia hispanica]
MKKKVFIIFMLISLISLLLIACGQNGETAEAQQKLERARKERRRREGGVLEDQRKAEIEYIQSATPDTVITVLGYHNDANWNGEVANAADFAGVLAVFANVPHRVDGQTEFLYNGTKIGGTAAGDASAEGKAVRKEIYLALHYESSFIIDFGIVFNKFINSPALVTKHAKELKEFFEKIRNYARAYYIDAYGTLRSKLGKLNSLSLDEARSLSAKLGQLESARVKLISGVIAQVKSDLNNSSPRAGGVHLKGSATTADQIKTYWESKSATFDADCAEIIRISGEIKGVLDDLK